jgi:CBS domain containing-hemolysin-like protein
VEEYLEKDKCYLLSTRLEIDYLNEKYKFEIPESDAYETLGGFIISHSEKIPDVDERLEIENFSIQVKKASPAMLELVCLSNNNPNPEK